MACHSRCLKGPTRATQYQVTPGESETFIMSAESQKHEASRDSRSLGMALQTRLLLGTGSVNIMWPWPHLHTQQKNCWKWCFLCVLCQGYIMRASCHHQFVNCMRLSRFLTCMIVQDTISSKPKKCQSKCTWYWTRRSHALEIPEA
jgi:hypothetical protein